MHRARLVPEVCILLCWLIVLTSLFRCTAPSNNLDSGHHVRRSKGHAEILGEEFELGMLWDEYGLVGDIVVRKFTISYTA
jgi:hypothetical protein